MDEGVFSGQTERERTEALGKGLELRRHRSEVKRRLKRGEIGLEEVFDDPDCARIRANELIRSLPGVGPTRAAEIQLALHMQPTRRVGGLGSRQRAKLIEMARRFGDRLGR